MTRTEKENLVPVWERITIGSALDERVDSGRQTIQG